MDETMGTRDTRSMYQWAYHAGGGELRAALSQAEREGDTELVTVIKREMERRGI